MEGTACHGRNDCTNPLDSASAAIQPIGSANEGRAPEPRCSPNRPQRNAVISMDFNGCFHEPRHSIQSDKSEIVLNGNRQDPDVVLLHSQIFGGRGIEECFGLFLLYPPLGVSRREAAKQRSAQLSVVARRVLIYVVDMISPKRSPYCCVTLNGNSWTDLQTVFDLAERDRADPDSTAGSQTQHARPNNVMARVVSVEYDRCNRCVE